MEPSALRATVLAVSLTLGIPMALYLGLLSLMVTAPSFQAHAIYLHKVTLTWFRDLNIPEQFGFAHRQVVPFYIPVPDSNSDADPAGMDAGVILHAWHVLPLGLYIPHYPDLMAQPGINDGEPVPDITATLNFRLLRDDPEARLILYFHGTSGTMASGYRPASYRALYAADPLRTHVLTFDYRGYGKSTGHPSEAGLIADALAVVEWATNVASIPPERIVIFGQSLGSAVAIALVQALASSSSSSSPSDSGPVTNFAGLVITASFSDIAALTATYRIGGLLPVLSPVAKVPPLFRFFTRRLSSTWDNVGRLSEFVRTAERYHVTLIHAEDDTDIPIEHSRRLFRAALQAAEEGKEERRRYEAVDGGVDLDARIRERTVGHGEGGSTTLWETENGNIRFEVLKYGVHDQIMAYPVTGMAVRRAFVSWESEGRNDRAVE